MHTFKLFWEYHKTTLAINWGISVGLVFFLSIGHFDRLNIRGFMMLFALLSISIGPLAVVSFKEISRQKEYYFYFNQGLSKIKLYAVSYLFSLVTFFIILFVSQYV